jgi:hypothetical protein
MDTNTKFIAVKELTGEPAALRAPQTAKDRTEVRLVSFASLEAAQWWVSQYNKSVWHPTMKLAVKEVAI